MRILVKGLMIQKKSNFGLLVMEWMDQSNPGRTKVTPFDGI